MVTKGIFKKLQFGGGCDSTVDILVATLVFRSKKYGDWFEDYANKVCDYEHEHGCLLDGHYVVGDAGDYDPALTAPINIRIKDGTTVIKGSQLVEYSSSYIDDVLNILALTSTVQTLSVINVRANIDEVVSNVCDDYERVYG